MRGPSRDEPRYSVAAVPARRRRGRLEYSRREEETGPATAAFTIGRWLAADRSHLGGRQARWRQSGRGRREDPHALALVQGKRASWSACRWTPGRSGSDTMAQADVEVFLMEGPRGLTSNRVSLRILQVDRSPEILWPARLGRLHG